MSPHPRIRRSTVFAAALALAIGACGSTVPSAPPTPGPTPGPTAPTETQRPASEIYAANRASAAEIRSLEPSGEADRDMIDKGRGCTQNRAGDTKRRKVSRVRV